MSTPDRSSSVNRPDDNSAAVCRGLTHTELVRRWRDGDPDALAELVRRHGPALRRHLRGRFRDGDLADEAYSEVLLKLADRRRPYRQDGAFRAWLFTVGRRCAIDLVRRRRRLGRLHEQAGESPVWSQTRPAGPDDRLEASDVRRAIDAAAATLPPAHRQAMRMRYQQDLSAREIGRRQGLTPRQARDRLAYVLRVLRQRVDPAAVAA